MKQAKLIRRLRLTMGLLAASLLLGGCAVVAVADAVVTTGAAVVSTGATIVKTGVKATGAVIDAMIPDGKEARK